MGIALYKNFDAELISGIIHVVNQYREDPKVRVRRYLSKCFEKWKEENQSIRDKALGIEFPPEAYQKT